MKRFLLLLSILTSTVSNLVGRPLNYQNWKMKRFNGIW